MTSIPEKENEFEPQLHLDRIAGIRPSVDLDHPFLQVFSDPSSLLEI